MRCSRRWCLALFAAALLTAVQAHAEDKKPETPLKPGASATPSDAKGDDEAEMKTFHEIPQGQTFQGLRVPQLSPEGKLLMQFDTKTATKLDDSHLQFEDLKIEIHNQDNSTFRVEMARSVFDLDTRILTSDTPTRIRRNDFEIVGEAAEFHTKTKFGRMTGRVKMIIFNTERIQ